MEANFNSLDFLKDLAEDLVDGFKKAGKATTPVLVGSAREKEVRNKLELIFPQSIGIATGCVIDTYGHTSKQTDIIMYEKDICPIFSINDTPESTYYPTEGVIAVGEIKSTLTTKELIDSFAKIKSVKQSKRAYKDNTCFRSYCSRQTIQGAVSQTYNQYEKPLDQIYGFILCEKIGLKIDTFLNKCTELIKEGDASLLPNIIISLHDGIFVYLNKAEGRVAESKLDADSFYNVINPHGDFQFLINNLNRYINEGRSTDILPFEKYILGDTSLPGNGTIVAI